MLKERLWQNLKVTVGSKNSKHQFSSINILNNYVLTNLNITDNTENGKIKPLASFDLSCDERLIVGGTEHTSGDAFILFWDIRQSNSKLENKNSLLGGYWESHMDDITCLTFHPVKRNVLVSGSTDGLMNIFDLTQSSEDLALTCSLNTESSVVR